MQIAGTMMRETCQLDLSNGKYWFQSLRSEKEINKKL